MKQGSDGQPYGLWMMVLSKEIPDRGPMDNPRFMDYGNTSGNKIGGIPVLVATQK